MGIEEGVRLELTVDMTVKSRHPLDRLLHRCRKVDMSTNALEFTGIDGDGPRFGAMIGLVAVVVATVILLFFGIGYALGRLFL